MLQRLEETGEMRVEYQDFSFDEDNDSDCEEEEGGEVSSNEQKSLEQEGRDKKCHKTMFNKLNSLLACFKSYCHCVPVLEFNSATPMCQF